MSARLSPVDPGLLGRYRYAGSLMLQEPVAIRGGEYCDIYVLRPVRTRQAPPGTP